MATTFVKAQYDADNRTMVAWTDRDRVELFYVYSQQEHDDRINRANLAEYLEDQFYENEIPEKYDGSYEKWADSFSYDDMSEMLFDSSHCCEWPDICRLAGLDPNDDNNAFGEWTASMPASHYKQSA